jgi:hypothetical protein
MADLTFDSTGTLYGWLVPFSADLHTIDLTTGAATLVGDAGIGTFGSGLAADAGDTLYLAGDGVDGILHTVDRTTGVPTPVTTLTGGPAGFGTPIGALDFNPNGVLYGVNLAFGGGVPAHLVTIDPGTGGVANLGQSVDHLDAIAFRVVPEPSSLALLGVGVAGFWRRRRARRRDAEH